MRNLSLVLNFCFVSLMAWLADVGAIGATLPPLPKLGDRAKRVGQQLRVGRGGESGVRRRRGEPGTTGA